MTGAEVGAGSHPKTTALKATQTAKKVSGLIKAYYARAQEASQNGEPIAWSMVDPGFPSELLYALGVFTVYPEHYATICAAKGANMGFIERGEREGYPLYTCSYARNGLGYAALMQELGGVPPGAPWGGMPQPTVLIGRTSCDPGLNWFTAFPRYTPVPLFVFDRATLPVETDYEDEAVKRRYISYYLGQTKTLTTFLERSLGKKIKWDTVSEYVAKRHRARWLYHQVHEMRKAVPCPLPSGDKFSCMFPNHYMLGTQEAVDFYQELYDEVKQRVENKIGVIPNEKYRLLFVGIPPWHNMAFFTALEEAGAVFAMETQYYPEAPNEGDLSNPLQALAERYWAEQVAEVSRAREEGVTDRRTGLVLRLAREYQVDGVVLHLIYSCRPNAIGATHRRDLLRERIEVPSFFLEGDICDPRVSSEAEVKAKVSAFLETVAAHKEKRTQANRA